MHLLRTVFLSACFAVTTASAQVYYSEDFEGTPTTTVSGGGWEYGMPTYGCTNVPQGAKCAGTDLDAYYGYNANYQLITPSIHLPDVSVLRLSFYEWYYTQSSYDYIYIEIEQNNSGIWNTFRSSSGSYSSWYRRTYDLSSYRNSSIRIRFRLTSNSSSNYYGWFIDDINIYQPINYSLTANAGTGGIITAPSSSPVSIECVTPYSIYASPSSGNRFDNWTVTSGNATFANTDAYSTTVSVTSDATIQANFAAGIVYPITSSNQQYDYATQHYQGTQSTSYPGVAFQFTAPAPGSYAIVVEDVLSSAYKYLYDYGTSPNFSSSSSIYRYGYGTLTLTFTAAAADEIHYFGVRPSNTSYENYDFYIRYETAATLSITSTSGGTTTPAGDTAVVSGSPFYISATPGTGYRFDDWTVPAGSANATITNPVSYSTYVTLTGDATVQANFTAGTVYPITTTVEQYNYTTHYYQGTSPGSLPGVAFEFTAPSAGSYAIVVEDVEETYKYLYDYGTSSTFSSYVTYTYGYGTLTMIFTATTEGETRYFGVRPYYSSEYSNNFSIRYTTVPTLTVTSDGNGTTAPSGSNPAASGIAQSITATPSSGYRFSSWSVTTGTASIADITAYSTDVTIDDDATIRANFTPGVIYTVNTTSDTYNFTTNYYNGSSPAVGVAFRFIAPSAGSFLIVAEDVETSTKSLTGYGSDNTFTSIVSSISGSGLLTETVTATASGQEFYFKVFPSMTSFWSNNFIVRYATMPTLTVTNDGNGTTTPAGDVAVGSSVPQPITATASAGYRFDTWTVTDGSASFVNASLFSTDVTITSDATIRADFTSGSLYDLTDTPTDYNFGMHYYEIDPSHGVRFRFTAPETGSFAVTLKNTDTTALYFYDFGTDATFTTYTRRQNSTSWNITFTFDATAGESHYFMATPTVESEWLDDFSIFWGPGLTLTPENLSATLRPEQTVTEHKTLHLPADISPPKADVMFIIDLTGSMGSALSRVKTNSVDIMNKIRELIPDTRFGVISHMDYYGSFSGCDYSGSYGSSGDYPYQLDQPLTDDAATVSTAINGLILGGGSDGPEDYVRPLYETYSDPAIGWRNGSKKIVLFWQDNLPHDCNYGLDTLPGRTFGPDPGRDATVGTDDDLDLATVLDSMASNKLTLISLHNGSNQALWDYYARRTGGNAFRINSDGSIPSGIDIASYLTGLIHEEVKQIDTLYLATCVPEFSGWLTSVTPPFYTDVLLDSAKDFTFDIVLTVPSEATPGTYNFNICALGDGAEYAQQSVAITVSDEEEFPPIADAGPDQTFSAGATCSATVPLDGSGSSDPDGGAIISYTWQGPGGPWIGVSPTITLPEGIHEIVLSVVDDEGSSSEDNVIITVVDNTPPVVPVLDEITTECSVTLTRPVATDNCSDEVTGTTDDPLTYSEAGTYTVHWIFTDDAGNPATQEQTVVVDDATSPVPDVATLPTLSGDCSVEVENAPTATDNCSGTITGTTSDPLTYSEEGTYTIHWVFTDDAENTATQEQTVVVHDVTPPVPDVATLPTLSSDCSIEVENAPTATDNCSGTITGTTSDPLTYSEEGTYTIHWVFTDDAENTATQEQTVVVHDATSPVPDVATLPALSGDCSVEVENAPTATDNCSGTVTGTTSDPLLYSEEGTYTIYWVFTDDAGNTATQEQTVSVVDAAGPVPDQLVLENLNGECSVTISEIPTATDNCNGVITGTTTDPLTYSEIGVHTVRWTYTDEAGNSTTQEQTVEVIDDTPPEPTVATLPDIIAECSATLTPPTADDNCSGSIAGTTATLAFDAQGTFTVEWTYTDLSGNSSTQEQTVIIRDTTAPVFDAVPSDTSIIISPAVTGVDVTLVPPTATDNCGSAAITASRSDGESLTAEYPAGATTVLWHACDENGNCDSTEQEITVTRNRPPVVTAIPDTTIDEGETLRLHISASDSDGTVPSISAVDGLPSEAIFTDSGNGAAAFSWETGCTSHGMYTVTIVADDGMDTDTMRFAITVRDLNFAPRFLTIPDTASPENSEFSLLIRTEDCDGDIPSIRAVSIPSGSSFQDNGDGTAQFEWTPDCDDNGYYIVVFETTDDHTTVRDTMLLQITDVNCYDPLMTLSAVAVSTGVHLPVSIAIHATDPDNTIPLLEADNLPEGAAFTTDGNGNAVFTWTPDEPGTYRPVFTAIDADDAQIRIDTTVTISVSDENLTGPSFLPCNDTIIDENQPFRLDVYAEDPDGSIPEIGQVELPPGAALTDNSDGSASITWTPGCAIHGNHLFTVYATDGVLSDTLDVLVTVRDQNCPPVINPITDKNVAFGGTVRFSVSATDPDEDMLPDLSVICDLPGYTFSVPEKGSGTFEWKANYESGAYPVTFIASDGYQSDTETVTISVEMYGAVSITAEPSEASLFMSPTASASGSYLGAGSASIPLMPGTYWFRAEAPGYRPSTFTGTVSADATCSLSVSLRPLIPQTFGIPDTLSLDGTTSPDLAGSITFTDFDGDGIQDLSVAGGNNLTVYTGSDSLNGATYRTPAINVALPPDLDSIVAHTYTDWNNDGTYECLLSLAGGELLLGSIINEEFVPAEVIVTRSGETLFPAVTDIDADGRKDLIIISKGESARLYFNNASDSAPEFDDPVTVADNGGETLSDFSSIPLIRDIDGDGRNDLIVRTGTAIRGYSTDTETPLQQLPQGNDLNAGGARITRGDAHLALCMLPGKSPRLAVLNSGTVLLYPLHLQGDINRDGTVDISDISKIAKAWELTEDDEEWNPACNLRLSSSGNGEIIDIGDISRASKNWELEE